MKELIEFMLDSLTSFRFRAILMNVRPTEVSTLAQQLHGATPQLSIQNCFAFVQQQITFQPEVNGSDDWQSPSQTIQRKAGDCEDKTALLMSLLSNYNIPTWLLVIHNIHWLEYHAVVLVKVPFQPVMLLDTTLAHPFNEYPPYIHDANTKVVGIYGTNLLNNLFIPFGVPLAYVIDTLSFLPLPSDFLGNIIIK